MKILLNFLPDRSIFYTLLYRLFQFYSNLFSSSFYIGNRRERSDSQVVPVLVPIEDDHEEYAPEVGCRPPVSSSETKYTHYSCAPLLVSLPSFDDGVLF